ncbi:hypothetical protein [Melissococcus plutonius]|uniref:hypothetical protein n=1 Tax=Melissococcus plutonius TaxID=33970 RepID=UPI0021E60C95|nr:hypothetical protein [Melissococcus plutonius]MCV2505557.1 hypothetical protein [Melissococcus plutonius]
MSKITELSDEQLDMLAEKITLKLTEEQQNEFKKMRLYAFHNTRLLLKNFDKLKAHVQTVADQLEEDKDTFWNHKYLTLSALMQNRAKTVKIMHHVDICLNEYEKMCNETGGRGYNLIEKKYFGRKMSDEAIAEYYNVDRTTINRQIKEAINELSILLYGIEALEIK